MNKYQEALDFIIKNSCPQRTICNECLMNKICNSEAKQHIDLLQELVEKSIPKKPEMMRIKKYDGYNVGICKCGKTIDTSLDDDVNFCPKCGQAIDWSDEENG